MASFSSALFLSLLVAISAFMATPSYVEAQINIIPPLPSLSSTIKINGTVFCALNVTLSPNGTVLGSPPPFPNAVVQFRCGNTTVANTTTNASGIFEIVLGSVQSLLSLVFSLLLGGSSNCKVVVTTPLAQCNATLPAVGSLVANVTQVVSGTLPVVGGLTNVINIIISQFQLSI